MSEGEGGAEAPSREGGLGLHLWCVFEGGGAHSAEVWQSPPPPVCREQLEGRELVSLWGQMDRGACVLDACTDTPDPPQGGALCSSGDRKGTAVKPQTEDGGIRCRNPFVQEVALPALESGAGFSFPCGEGPPRCHFHSGQLLRQAEKVTGGWGTWEVP